MNQDQEKIDGIRHSLAHLLADTVKQMFPGSLNAIGPVIENGFYQDFEIKGKLKEEDLPKIEEAMRAKLSNWKGFSKKEVSLEEAKQVFGDNKYKIELAEEFAAGGKTLTIYTIGGFDDLCKGGHADDLSLIEPDSFKLTSTAGAYWRGDEKNIMLTRIYGVAFETKDELEAYLKQQELAKERDHRKLGRELDLFTFSELVGSGLPLYTPRGTLIRDNLVGLSEKLRSNIGFVKVWSPHITKKDLYEVSGHWSKFGDELFLVESQETSDKLVMKPMNCPHHSQIYVSRPRTYKELPLKLMETTTNYRDEKTGELHGLSRVRSLSQDDSHTYCTEDQVEEVFHQLIGAIKLFYGSIDMKLGLRISLRDDSDAYLGDKKLWEFGQDKLRKIAKENSLDYYEEEGEAAFYGPKLDFMAEDAIGRKWQVATIQFDFVQPERFKLKYIDRDGREKQPIMVHCAIMGSFDRFFGVFIEHTNGHFPFWLAPEQIRIVTVNDSVNAYVAKVKDILSGVVLMKPLKYNELRFEEDARKENLGKKIRVAEEMKIPLILIVGPKDMEAETVSLRFRAGDETVEEKIKLSGLAEWITKFNG
jgi:threonyl-tRNA synthetase